MTGTLLGRSPRHPNRPPTARIDLLKPLQARQPPTKRAGEPEFINDGVLEFARRNGIEFTRSRPYRKNDQAWVEQKNGSVVRRMVGYGRLSGLAAAESLSRLYSSTRLFVNFFQPSFKLLGKERIGARVRKTYSAPATPASRLLSSEHLDDASKEKLRAVLASLDPLRLLDEIRTMQRHLASLAAGAEAYAPPSRSADLERFLASLSSAWEKGEARPTHRKKAKNERDWRTRKDPFESVWPKLVGWLEAEPDMPAKEALARLQAEHPGAYPKGQLRTLQRRVREWRALAVRRLMFTGEDEPTRDLGGGPIPPQKFPQVMSLLPLDPLLPGPRPGPPRYASACLGQASRGSPRTE